MAKEKLQIELTALDKTKAAFSSVTKSIKKVSGAIFNMKSALGVAAGAAGIGFLAKRSLDATDNLSKMARILGFTVEELSALQHAANLGGVSVETVAKATRNLSRQAADFVDGGGEAADTFERLGITSEDLAKVQNDQLGLFTLVADRISQLDSGFIKLNAAQELFGGRATSLLPVLEEGGEGLRKMFQEAEQLGLVMSTDAALGVEEANDAFTRLGSLFKGILDQTTAALAPALQQLADLLRTRLTDAIENTNGSVRQFGQNLAVFVIDAVARTLEALGQLIRGTAILINRFVDATNSMAEFVGLTDRLNRVVPDLGQGLLSIAVTVRGLADGLGKGDGEDSLNTNLNNTKNKVNEVREAVMFTKPVLKDVTITGSRLGKEFDGPVKNAIQSVEDSLVNLVSGAGSAKDAFKNMASSIINDMIRMMIQRQITQPLMNMFFPTSAFTPATPATQGSFAGGGFTGMGARSGGVDGKGGFPAILHPNETVIDHTRGQSMGGDVNVTLNMSVGVAQTVRTEVASLMPQIANTVKAAVVDARRRGGSFAGAFGA